MRTGNAFFPSRRQLIPGTVPQYRPDFPAALVAPARCLVRRRTISYQLRQRAHLVLLLQRHPRLSNVAAAQVELHPNSVRHWRQRCHGSLPPAPGRITRIEHEYIEHEYIEHEYIEHEYIEHEYIEHEYIEHEYERGGALQYLAAWDVRRGYVMGHCEPSTGIEPFGRLVAQGITQPPYCQAERVFGVWTTVLPIAAKPLPRDCAKPIRKGKVLPLPQAHQAQPPEDADQVAALAA